MLEIERFPFLEILRRIGLPSFKGVKLLPEGIVILQGLDHLSLFLDKSRRPGRELWILGRSYRSFLLLLLWSSQKPFERFPEDRREDGLPAENIDSLFSLEEPRYLRKNPPCFLNLLNDPFEEIGILLTEELCGSGKLLNQEIPSPLLSLLEKWKERNKFTGRDLLSFNPERKKKCLLKKGLALLLKKRQEMRGFSLDEGEEPLLLLSLSYFSLADEVDKGPLRNFIVLQPFAENLSDLRKAIFSPDKGSIDLVEIASDHNDPSLESLID